MPAGCDTVTLGRGERGVSRASGLCALCVVHHVVCLHVLRGGASDVFHAKGKSGRCVEALPPAYDV